MMEVQAWIDQGQLKRAPDLVWFDREPEFLPLGPSQNWQLKQTYLYWARQAWSRGDLAGAVMWVFRGQESLHG